MLSNGEVVILIVCVYFLRCGVFVVNLYTGAEDRSCSDQLKSLHMELRKKHRAGELDGYCLYVYVMH